MLHLDVCFRSVVFLALICKLSLSRLVHLAAFAYLWLISP